MDYIYSFREVTAQRLTYYADDVLPTRPGSMPIDSIDKCYPINMKLLMLQFTHILRTELIAQLITYSISPRWRHQMETFFRVTGHLCGEFTGHRWSPRTRASDRDLWCFFDLRFSKRLSKYWWVWWFETLSCSLWRHCDTCAKVDILGGELYQACRWCSSLYVRLPAALLCSYRINGSLSS